MCFYIAICKFSLLENGSKITYCEFHGEKKYPGETWVAEDHENCSCDVKEGLKCCK